ncbi:mono/diheme cytochrome c family protein [Litoreibacter halocynthiae]|uniref:Mono/diheme cytochrome c family protein n=1 Tax=Litoreibacter halocynthiae TaxID=1242689 RepID=A0A4R7LB62_9RHOB|nr:cytochrome c [Litoreibacter halocynthiae]TDT72707.1 mono/diheme cytochrome c family protein [Litoreibacter halocynthiae]
MRVWMWLLLAGACTGLGVIAATAVWPIGIGVAGITQLGDVERGAYLARASGCIACHTNAEVGGAPLAGGAPLKTDFGRFYPPNLTTDVEFGIGGWTVDEFAKAVRQGISPDGEPYYPTFTYPFYANFTDQDVADLWAAFQTVPAVNEAALPHDTSFPFDQRWGLKLWRAAFLAPTNVEPVQGKSDAWNRGKLLVRGAAHCAACHTPRNLAGARIASKRFTGNALLPVGGKAPSILPEDLLAEGWSVDDLAYALRSGITPSGDVFGGSMAEVVKFGTGFLSDDDLEAMATYVMDSDI